MLKYPPLFGRVGMSDIVDSLYDKGIWPIPNLHYEAADEITRLRAENEKLRKALIEIQWKAQDTIRPVPFQENDDEN